ncbi:hypothetical protein N836_14845 [Leptolyngbya sp. Heron Island J]|uniref:hypothetical protein n=1 Tax=Leptolyngbya sp. Heron Island J TaxID=1385935 RepID=UPI0003B97F14|nr:hypothetical protein [Leptolyngbya sp. Heron Island J]ESA34694.1 hypothetical protein N836_14845 [Leptolyngbya sp. Heron Island J]
MLFEQQLSTFSHFLDQVAISYLTLLSVHLQTVANLPDDSATNRQGHDKDGDQENTKGTGHQRRGKREEGD